MAFKSHAQRKAVMAKMKGRQNFQKEFILLKKENDLGEELIKVRNKEIQLKKEQLKLLKERKKLK